MAHQDSSRIITLDIVRGVAVMGILAMNIVAFAMPPQAYINPLAYGTEGALDLAAYAFNFIFIDGKMRGLFSFLYGASLLLVIQLAERSGQSPAKAAYARQFWLLVFGLAHYYLIWWGDILIGYALIGMVAWLFRGKPAEKLLAIGLSLIIAQFALFAAIAVTVSSWSTIIATPNPPPAIVAGWATMTHDVAIPTAAILRQELALALGPWSSLVEHQLTAGRWMPFIFNLLFGWETLGYMLLGMAGLKSGFLTGDWSVAAYRKVAVTCIAIGIIAYAVFLGLNMASDFSVPSLFTWSNSAPVLFRPLLVMGYAAVIILATRGGGWLVDRIAAAGRAAFSNYLGTSLVMTFIFNGWGLGYFGALDRAELWLVVLAAWVLMLLWSKPWLERFRYGPLEWLWRSLARGKLQPMVKGPGEGAAKAGA